ncbi:GntR family transcriptional regulator [Natronospirillum operosum]|uniref:GntR family transcriptional regulator n=1 Tax=Natronospirillum operosum TaxID=2759953 RepID=A0A4Z0WB56_9GAMM|nr:GntR family transcriptional regulator [Natronospirillum operosum]TGG93595.1 GntR family transcriptional regulator [Natronospirillum operosum]
MVTQSGKSLHHQVMEDLLRRITVELSGDDMLPSEKQLCAEYGVSRITIRAAIAKLVDRGLLFRKRGVGTFVTRSDNSSNRTFNLIGYLDEIQSHTYDIVCDRAIPASEPIAKHLDLSTGQDVRHIRSAVKRNGEVITVSDSYTPDTAQARITAHDFNAGVPTFHALSQRLGIKLDHAAQTLCATAVQKPYSDLLGVADGTPVIKADRIYLTRDDKPVQFVEIRYHPERFQLSVDLILRENTTLNFRPDSSRNSI